MCPRSTQQLGDFFFHVVVRRELGGQGCSGAAVCNLIAARFEFQGRCLPVCLYVALLVSVLIAVPACLYIALPVSVSVAVPVGLYIASPVPVSVAAALQLSHRILHLCADCLCQ